MAALATVSGENGKIVYVVGYAETAEIYIADSDGSDPVRLTNNGAADTDPAWSPDGRMIAFASMRDGDSAVYTMELDGSNQRRLAAGADPAWSPDGIRIVYSGPREIHDQIAPDFGVRWKTDLFVFDLVSGVSARLTDAADDPRFDSGSTNAVIYRDPAWSPDGQRIAWIKDVGGPTPLANDSDQGLAVANIDDPHHPAVYRFIADEDPDWAPDGESILAAQAGGLSVYRSELVLIDPDTGEWTEIGIESPDENFFVGSFSPDGRQIVAAAETVESSPSDIRLERINRHSLARTPLIDAAWSGSWQPVNPYPVGLVDPTTGIWRLRDAAGAVKSFFYGNPGDLPFVGDWDCDGVDTPGLYRQSDGYVYLRNSNTQGIADFTFFFGNPGDIPIAGDFNGDGCDTVSVYRPSESRVFIINMLGSNGGGLGAAETDYLFGNPGDTAFGGDFDGDGIDTIGLHRASTGLVYYRNTHTQGIADDQFLFGNPGDRFTTNDWNNDGIDTPMVFRPTNTTHYFRFTNTQGAADAQYIWGQSHWLPITGDLENS